MFNPNLCKNIFTFGRIMNQEKKQFIVIFIILEMAGQDLHCWTWYSDRESRRVFGNICIYNCLETPSWGCVCVCDMGIK